MKITDRILAPLAVALITLSLAGCSREPRNDFLVRFQCEFKGLEKPLPVMVDLGRLRLGLQTSSDTWLSVPLKSIDGQLVFENDPRSDQSMKLWMRGDGGAKFRTKLEAGGKAVELAGTCRRAR